jgi:predicted small metal-binding protein
MWDQRNQQFSNIAVATTIVITGLITVLIQGVLPPGCTDFIVISYSLSNSLSMGLLFVCAVLCLEVIWRASEFMYGKTKIHSNHVKKALRQSDNILQKIRWKKKYWSESTSEPEKWEYKARRFLELTDEEIEKEFVKHQEEVHKYLERREKIINNASEAIYKSDRVNQDLADGSNDDNFSHFWRKYCRFYSNMAIFFFYGGSATLFTSTLLCMWAYFDVMWSCPDAGYVAVAIMFCGLAACFFVALYLRMFDRKYLEEIEELKKKDEGRKGEVADLGMDIPVTER